MSWPVEDVRVVVEEWRMSRTLGSLTEQEWEIGRAVLDRLAMERGWTPPGGSEALMAYARFAGLIQNRAGRAGNMAELIDGITDALKELRAATGPLKAEVDAR